VATVKVRWTRLALEDLDQARDYITARSPSSAHAMIDRIESALRALREYPQMGRPGRVEGTRELVVPDTPFVIPYRFSRKFIEILAVIHGRRRWPEDF
jgi:toxin ParE1/3/4